MSSQNLLRATMDAGLFIYFPRDPDHNIYFKVFDGQDIYSEKLPAPPPSTVRPLTKKGKHVAMLHGLWPSSLFYLCSAYMAFVSVTSYLALTLLRWAKFLETCLLSFHTLQFVAIVLHTEWSFVSIFLEIGIILLVIISTFFEQLCSLLYALLVMIHSLLT